MKDPELRYEGADGGEIVEWNDHGYDCYPDGGRLQFIQRPLSNISGFENYVKYTSRFIPEIRNHSLCGIGFYTDGKYYGVSIPYWSIAVVLLIVAYIPWFQGHFGLRTLLIATMLVAAGLGLIVWVAG